MRVEYLTGSQGLPPPLRVAVAHHVMEGEVRGGWARSQIMAVNETVTHASRACARKNEASIR